MGACSSADKRDPGEALRAAAAAGREDEVRRLAPLCQNVDAPTDGGETPLMVAAAGGYATVVDALLGAGADPYARDASGRSAWDVASGDDVSRRLAAACGTVYDLTQPIDGERQPPRYEALTKHWGVPGDDAARAGGTIDPGELEVDIGSRPLGRGAFGVVRRGVLRGEAVAVKEMRGGGASSDKESAAFADEFRLQSRLEHENVVRVHGSCQPPGSDDGRLCIVLELCAGGTLDEYVAANAATMTDRRRAQLVLDVARGMRYLHGDPLGPGSNPVLHLDLKPGNVLVDGGGRAKVSDFGLAQVTKTKSGATCMIDVATVKFIAPEVLCDDERAVLPSVDVYAFGLVAYHVFAGKSHAPQLPGTLPKLYRALVVEQWRPDIPDTVPAAASDLVLRCLSPDPAARPAFAAIVDEIESWY